MGASLLMVEDNAGLAESLVKGFSEARYAVRHEGSGAGAWRALESGGIDALVLDLGLPDFDGVELLSRIRARGWHLPILVLTAREAVQSRVEALNAGADDYVVKPFAFEELLARVGSLLRRAALPATAPLPIAGLQLRGDDPVVIVEGREVALSPREHRLLQFLMSRLGETATRKDLLREVFGYEFDPGTNLVDVHVSHLRGKLAGAQVEIQTVRGFGYRLQSVPRG